MLSHILLLLNTYADLGIQVYWKRSDLIPLLTAKYMGMVINAGIERVFPTEVRKDKSREMPFIPELPTSSFHHVAKGPVAHGLSREIGPS